MSLLVWDWPVQPSEKPSREHPEKSWGGLLATLAVTAGSYLGVQNIPTESKAVRTKIATNTAVMAGLSAALGAAGGGLGVLGSLAGGAVLSGRVIDMAEGLLAHGPQAASTGKPDAFQDVVLKTSDGLQLSAWLTPEKEDAPMAIFFHSNGTNLDDNLGRIETLQDLGFRVLAPEYRGYAGNPGIPSERGLKKDAEAAYDLAKTLAPTEKILLVGQSLGGGVAANLAAEHPHAGLVLESTFTSLASASEEMMGNWGGKLTRGRYQTINTVANLDTPLFVAHGGRDAMVRTEAGQALSENAPTATYFRSEFAGHLNVAQSDGFKESLETFLTQNKIG